MAIIPRAIEFRPYRCPPKNRTLSLAGSAVFKMWRNAVNRHLLMIKPVALYIAGVQKFVGFVAAGLA